MLNKKFALITLSYAPDFERCKILCESVKKYVGSLEKHYIVVDKRDFSLFKQLQGPKTEILTVESLLPWWIMRLPLTKQWWLSFKSPPIRNWILQQVVKLSMASHVKEDALVFVDSDVTFIRPFNLSTMEKNGKIRLFRLDNCGFIPEQYKWYRTAGRLLGLPAADHYGAGYIGNLISWKRENVFKLYKRIEEISGKGWLETVCQEWNLSEYILYGVFIDKILKNDSAQYYDQQNLCLDYWQQNEVSEKELQTLIDNLKPEYIAVMISSKANINMENYKALLQKLEITMR